jgi:hypothetical protein
VKHNYTKYEYMTSTITNEAGLELDKLNKLGKLGWELVAVVDKVTFPFHKGYHILYFKRVIEATAPSAKKK